MRLLPLFASALHLLRGTALQVFEQIQDQPLPQSRSRQSKRSTSANGTANDSNAIMIA
jgi:hypothetical protein